MVVVLIIGILAAIAVPQYQKAVEKSRAAEAFSNLNSIYNAQQVYNMQHGGTAGAPSFEDMDITIPGTSSGQTLFTKNFKYTLHATTWYNNYAYRIKSSKNVYGFVTTETNWYCCWFDENYSDICKSQGFTKEASSGWIAPSLGCKGKF